MAYALRGWIIGCLISLVFVPLGRAQSSFSLQNSRLLLDGQPFAIRGVVYSPIPIGISRWDAFPPESCLYSRDFPLIAAMGANTIRTTALIPAGDWAFQEALEQSNLYWLAGFPLVPYYDPERSLAADAGAVGLRDRILTDFEDFVDAWAHHPRLIAFVFGDEVGTHYSRKFAGSPRDFYLLLRDAARIVNRRALLTTTIGDPQQTGSIELGSFDANQLDLSFWSLNRLGGDPFLEPLLVLKSRTTKPILISSFGIDAYNGAQDRPDRESQATAARDLAVDLDRWVKEDVFAVLGGVWASFHDEWWRDQSGPGRHGTLGVRNTAFPDGVFHPSWLGLFGVAPSETPGLDALRARDAYFALAEAWSGTTSGDIVRSDRPAIGSAGLVNLAGGNPQVSPGSLAALTGDELTGPATRPAAAVCIGGRAMSVFHSRPDEVRGQLSWNQPLGESPVVVYRSGRPSKPAPADVAEFSPGIFDRGVLASGRPCPIDTANGVRPGSYLEIYGTGLGTVAGPPLTGLPSSGALPATSVPEVWLGIRQVEPLYSGLLPGLIGVYQTNIRVPLDFPPSLPELHLVQGSVSSNRHSITVIAEEQDPGFELVGPQPGEFFLQAGGPVQSAFITVRGINSFCDLIRFRFDGLPPGVTPSIPVSFPGQTTRMTLRAEPGAPQVSGARAQVTGFSVIQQEAAAPFRVTVLPTSGGISFRVVSGGYLSTNPIASFEMAGELLYKVSGGGPGRGFNFVTLDPQTGALGSFHTFDTFGNPDDVVALENYLLGLPLGTLVLGAVADEATHLLTERTRRLLEQNLAAQLISMLGFQHSWAIITQKGALAPIAEGLRPNGVVVLDRVLNFPLN